MLNKYVRQEGEGCSDVIDKAAQVERVLFKYLLYSSCNCRDAHDIIYQVYMCTTG